MAWEDELVEVSVMVTAKQGTDIRTIKVSKYWKHRLMNDNEQWLRYLYEDVDGLLNTHFIVSIYETAGVEHE